MPSPPPLRMVTVELEIQRKNTDMQRDQEQLTKEWDYVAGYPTLNGARVIGNYTLKTNVWGIGYIMWSIVTGCEAPRGRHPSLAPAAYQPQPAPAQGQPSGAGAAGGKAAGQAAYDAVINSGGTPAAAQATLVARPRGDAPGGSGRPSPPRMPLGIRGIGISRVSGMRWTGLSGRAGPRRLCTLRPTWTR